MDHINFTLPRHDPDDPRAAWHLELALVNVFSGVDSAVLAGIVRRVSRALPGMTVLTYPESGLHGSVVHARTRGLCRDAASTPFRLAIATHSEHVLNAVRLAVKDGDLKPDDVRLYHFHSADTGTVRLITGITRPLVDGSGNVDHWPEGFFDQWDKELDELVGHPSASEARHA